MDGHRGESRRADEPDAGALASGNGCFECNICLDVAAEPVVTLCGHLYCWPCIYRWLQQAESAAPQLCPVCKAALSLDTLVPLYGRGHRGCGRNSHPGVEVPRRPWPARRGAIGPNEARYPEIRPHRYLQPSHSMAGGVLGGLAVAVLSWMARDQEWASVDYSNPYHMGGNEGSRRRRRREMELERSFHQIWKYQIPKEESGESRQANLEGVSVPAAAAHLLHHLVQINLADGIAFHGSTLEHEEHGASESPTAATRLKRLSGHPLRQRRELLSR
ncbi:unnamed protein product [Musa banksii]